MMGHAPYSPDLARNDLVVFPTIINYVASEFAGHKELLMRPKTMFWRYQDRNGKSATKNRFNRMHNIAENSLKNSKAIFVENYLLFFEIPDTEATLTLLMDNGTHHRITDFFNVMNSVFLLSMNAVSFSQ